MRLDRFLTLFIIICSSSILNLFDKVTILHRIANGVSLALEQHMKFSLESLMALPHPYVPVFALLIVVVVLVALAIGRMNRLAGGVIGLVLVGYLLFLFSNVAAL
jgi:hypothetical protein